LPDLVEVLGPPPSGTLGPEALGEPRTIAALAAFLDALGTPSRPALVLLDDCQWADEVALKLLLHFHQRRRDVEGRRPGHLLVVASFRSEEVSEGHPLRMVPDARRVVLPTLSPDEVRALAESMAGVLPNAATRVVTELAGGSPFMATAVLRGMVE